MSKISHTFFVCFGLVFWGVFCWAAEGMPPLMWKTQSVLAPSWSPSGKQLWTTCWEASTVALPHLTTFFWPKVHQLKPEVKSWLKQVELKSKMQLNTYSTQELVIKLMGPFMQEALAGFLLSILFQQPNLWKWTLFSNCYCYPAESQKPLQVTQWFNNRFWSTIWPPLADSGFNPWHLQVELKDYEELLPIHTDNTELDGFSLCKACALAPKCNPPRNKTNV